MENSFFERSWGGYKVLDEFTNDQGKEIKIKTLYIKKGKNISYQKHFQRTENWRFLKGKGYFVLDNISYLVNGVHDFKVSLEQWHCYYALEDTIVLEIQTGICEEEDIERMYIEWQDVVENAIYNKSGLII